MVSVPNPDGSPALAAATEAILNRRLAASHWDSADDAAHRAAILLNALPDAAAALEAAEPHIRAQEARRIGRMIEPGMRALASLLAEEMEVPLW